MPTTTIQGLFRSSQQRTFADWSRGRFVPHLKPCIEDEANVIVPVGWRVEHTLGRKLAEEWNTVPIFETLTQRRAQVIRLHGYPAHADRDDYPAYAFPNMEVEVPRTDSLYDLYIHEPGLLSVPVIPLM